MNPPPHYLILSLQSLYFTIHLVLLFLPSLHQTSPNILVSQLPANQLIKWRKTTSFATFSSAAPFPSSTGKAHAVLLSATTNLTSLSFSKTLATHANHHHGVMKKYQTPMALAESTETDTPRVTRVPPPLPPHHQLPSTPPAQAQQIHRYSCIHGFLAPFLR